MCNDSLHKSSDNKIILVATVVFFSNFNGYTVEVQAEEVQANWKLCVYVSDLIFVFLKNARCRAINLDHFVYASEVILLSYLSLLV